MKQTSLHSFFGPPQVKNDAPPEKLPELKEFLTDIGIPFTKFTSTTFGSHLSNTKGYLSAAERAKTLNFNCFQIFFDTGFGTKDFYPISIEKCKKDQRIY